MLINYWDGRLVTKSNHLLLPAILLFTLPACVSEQNVWGTVKTATPGPTRSIGSYANGCIAGARSLPPDGTGYQVMRLTRGRFYGNPELIDYITSLGNYAAKHHSVVLIGDMGQPRGGPITGGHSSHQTGLDVDIWYTHPDSAITSSLTLEEREELSAGSLVLADESDIDGMQWNNFIVSLLRKAASDKNVDRIFVHPVIKRKLCAVAKGSAWLRKIRPWWDHNDHFHVRLKCPPGDKDCLPQPPVPSGDGCDATLVWWFSDEAKAEKNKPHDIAMTETPMKAMPAACGAVLTAH